MNKNPFNGRIYKGLSFNKKKPVSTGNILINSTDNILINATDILKLTK